jgi:sulfur carrier protein
MKIVVNGEFKDVPDRFTIVQLLELSSLLGQRIAIEVNSEIIPRSRYAAYWLKPGDRVEVVHAIGGG